MEATAQKIDAGAVYKYAIAARETGCPRDQLENFYRGGYIAQPKQLLFHALARQADHPNGPDQIGFGGSRGPGKSHAIFAQVALDDCQRYPGLKALYLRKVGKQAREQIDDLRRKVLYHVPHKYNRNSGVIEFGNGSRIIVGHFRNESDIDNYLGIEYDIIAIEETTTLTVTKYKALRDSNRSSMPGFRERMYNSTNPGGVGHAWYKDRFIDPYRTKTETFTRFIPATVDDNAYIKPGYKRKLEENTGWRLRAYRFGDWDIAAGQFFSTFRNDIHVIKPFRIPKDWRVWLSMDYGFVHYTVVHLWAMDGDGNVYTLDEYYGSRTQVSQHAASIQAMIARWGIDADRIYKFVAGSDVFARKDEGPTIADQYKRQGIRLRPAKMDRVNGWAEMLGRLGDVEAKIPPRWRIFDTCIGLARTLPMMEHNPNRPEDVLKVDVDEDGNGGDDFVDCARYGIMEAAAKSKAVSAEVDWRGKRPVDSYEPDYRTQAEIDKLLREAEHND